MRIRSRLSVVGMGLNRISTETTYVCNGYNLRSVCLDGDFDLVGAMGAALDAMLYPTEGMESELRGKSFENGRAVYVAAIRAAQDGK